DVGGSSAHGVLDVVGDHELADRVVHGRHGHVVLVEDACRPTAATQARGGVAVLGALAGPAHELEDVGPATAALADAVLEVVEGVTGLGDELGELVLARPLRPAVLRHQPRLAPAPAPISVSICAWRWACCCRFTRLATTCWTVSIISTSRITVAQAPVISARAAWRSTSKVVSSSVVATAPPS